MTDKCETEDVCDICEQPMEKDYHNPYSEEINGEHVQLMLCNFCYSDILKEPLHIKWSIEEYRKKEIAKRMRPLDYYFIIGMVEGYTMHIAGYLVEHTKE